jgi:hypothetical protein
MKILVILVISIVVFGGLISLIRIFRDKTSDVKIIYKIRIIDLVAKLYISVPFCILMIATLYMIVAKIFIDSIYYAFALLLPIILGFLSIPSLILFYQYFKIEIDRIIEFDPEERKLTIKSKNDTKVIINDDIKLVEYHNATTNKGPFDFEYIKLTLNDGSNLILTNLLTDVLNYERLFKGIKRKHNKMRIFNKITLDNKHVVVN